MNEKSNHSYSAIFLYFGIMLSLGKCAEQNKHSLLTDTATPNLVIAGQTATQNEPCHQTDSATAQFAIPSVTRVHSKQGYNLLIRGMSCICDLHFREEQRRDDYQYTTGIGGHKFHGRSVTFNDARKICEREGGHLAIVDSDAEAQILLDLSTRSDSVSGTSLDGAAWVGIHDLYAEGEWVTIFNDPVDSRGYTRWGKGQPDNYQGLEHCGSLLTKIFQGRLPAGTLADLPCKNFLLPFWCEIPEVQIV